MIQAPDAERIVRDELEDRFTELEDEDVTVGIGVPSSWTSSSKPHLQIAVDNVNMTMYPVAIKAATRIVAWSPSTSESKRLTALAQAVLADADDGNAISGVIPTGGPVASRDLETKAEIAMTTNIVIIRTETF